VARLAVDGHRRGRPDHQAGNQTLSIGIGGALGLIMLLNVWGIIWPAQKRIIAATAAGTPPDAALARRAFLASRTNAWLSLPMLFFMGTSRGDWQIFGRARANRSPTVREGVSSKLKRRMGVRLTLILFLVCRDRPTPSLTVGLLLCALGLKVYNLRRIQPSDNP
jgi:hypothetical protein